MTIRNTNWPLKGEFEEDVLAELSRRTDANLAVTDGSRGSWALYSNELLHQPAFEVEATDTTGCGDAFHGAYAFALLQEWEFPQRLEFAAYVASQIALGFGGRSNLPSRGLFEEADLGVLSDALRKSVRRWLAESAAYG